MKHQIHHRSPFTYSCAAKFTDTIVSQFLTLWTQRGDLPEYWNVVSDCSAPIPPHYANERETHDAFCHAWRWPFAPRNNSDSGMNRIKQEIHFEVKMYFQLLVPCLNMAENVSFRPWVSCALKASTKAHILRARWNHHDVWNLVFAPNDSVTDSKATRAVANERPEKLGFNSGTKEPWFKEEPVHGGHSRDTYKALRKPEVEV